MVNKKQFYRTSITTILVSLLLFITAYFNNNLSHHKAEHQTINIPYQIPISIQKNMTFGYDYTLSALQWFHLISKFGNLNEANKTNISYVELAKNLDTITHLNPHAKHAYYMAATILPWATHSTKLSRPLLKRAIKTMPKQWQWPYYEGFNAYWFDHDIEHAAQLMSQAASLPNSPPLIAKLAARMQAKNGNLEAALIFLQSLLQQKQDSTFKVEIEKQIKLILTEKILLQVDHILKNIPLTQRNKATLHKLGNKIPITLPDGGFITFNKHGGVISSKNNKRYQLFIPLHRQKNHP